MKVSVKGITFSAAMTWGLVVLFVGVINLASPSYGLAFLELVSSIYPGYHPVATVGNVIVGTLYAIVDGAVGGAIFACLYNAAAK
ncbi:MAG: hypothetical protein ACM3SP_24645 [Chloroflexota bacterium]